MIAVTVHQMITVSSEVLPQFCDNPLNFYFCKICVSNVNGLPAQEKRVEHNDYTKQQTFIYLNLNCSPNSSASLGVISKAPEKA